MDHFVKHSIIELNNNIKEYNRKEDYIKLIDLLIDSQNDEIS